MFALLCLLAVAPVHAASRADGDAPADPLFDLGLHGFAGPAGGVALDMATDLAGRGGVAAMAWPARRVGLGLRMDLGSYGLVEGDMGNAFAFVEGQVRIDPDWAAGVGFGTPIVFVDYACGEPPCEEGLWERHHPIVAVQATRHLEHGALHLPLSLRGELSAARWAVGLDLGIGLRAHRRRGG